MSEIVDERLRDTVIKVIGVGDYGSNAVDCMIANGVQGVKKFIAINTDAQALKCSKAPSKLQIGATHTQGMAPGSIPDAGHAATEEDRSRIAELISGAHMVFIIAGMGGRTGTGAATVLAQIAYEMDILSVAVVTKPFAQDDERMRLAEAGIETLLKHVDTLIVVPNEKSKTMLGENATKQEVMRYSNSVLQDAVASVANAINISGLVCVDFSDMRDLMSENGMAIFGRGTASGQNRAKVAAERAISCLLLEDVNLEEAGGAWAHISSTSRLTLKEYREVHNSVEFTAKYANKFVTSTFNEDMGDELRVTIVVTGLGSNKIHA